MSYGIKLSKEEINVRLELTRALKSLTGNISKEWKKEIYKKVEILKAKKEISDKKRKQNLELRIEEWNSKKNERLEDEKS